MGPGAIEAQIAHSAAFAESWEAHTIAPPDRFLDLGSGGGLPGLYLLDRWRGRSEGIFLDAMAKRTDLLTESLGLEGAPPCGVVVLARAEDAAWDERWSESCELVTARSFGPPAVVAECAARFLKLGGVLMVSDPPHASQAEARWDSKGLAELGLVTRGTGAGSSAIRVIEKVSATPDRYPRRNGVPRKRPLF